jgi:hypothetical protein
MENLIGHVAVEHALREFKQIYNEEASGYALWPNRKCITSLLLGF